MVIVLDLCILNCSMMPGTVNSLAVYYTNWGGGGGYNFYFIYR